MRVVAGALLLALSGALPLRPVVDVPLTGNPTRLDYEALDPARHLLYVAHLGDGAVVVVDTRRRTVVKTIDGIDRVHGVLVAPGGIVYATATGTNEVVAIDERTLTITGRAPAGVYPDGMAFEPHAKHLFISDERGRTETVVDARRMQAIATIQLGGEAGNSQYDPATGRILVNVQTAGHIAVIDPSSNRIDKTIPVDATGCIGNHGLLVDARHRRAFVACEDSATFLTLNLQTGRIVYTATLGEDPDVLAYDPARGMLLVAAESGVVTLFRVDARPTKIAEGFFAANAHTVAVDPGTQEAYFPLQDVGGKPVLRVVAMPPR